MKEDEIKELDVDLTVVLRQLTVLEKEVEMVDEELENLKKDLGSGDISDRAAKKLESKFLAERGSLLSAIEKVLTESIEKSKKLQEILEKKLEESK